RSADGSTAEERLSSGDITETATGWSPDGKRLLLVMSGDIYSLAVEGGSGQAKDSVRVPVIKSAFEELGGTFSPDGLWVAYSSNQSGRSEVYVQPYPGPGQRIQISTDGGSEALWARNGHELFCRNGNKMMAVSVSLQPVFTAGTPHLL